MRVEDLSNPAVRAAIAALNDGDRESFFAQFAADTELTDDGLPQSFTSWADRELFDAHAKLHVGHEDEGGQHVSGWFHADQWQRHTHWWFRVEDGLITQLDVAAG